MKKLILIVGASSLLMGCGSQNLAPLEDKTTELRDDNHQLKLDIQELNQEIGEHKSKIAALKQDKENTKELIDNLISLEDKEFHAQIEMLSYSIPEVKEIQDQHNDKMKELTYQCLKHYVGNKEITNLKSISNILFNSGYELPLNIISIVIMPLSYFSP